jgi:tRNA C32,U32 (ribose-2'-O)-methylase TrmJ
MSYEDPSFSPPLPAPVQPQRSWLPTCLIGCLVIGVVCVVVCGGVVWYIARNVKQIASNVARETIVSMVRQSDLDPEEKQAIIAQVDRVVGQFKSGQITTEQLGRVFEEVGKSTVIQALLVASLEKQHLARSGLSDEEKQTAHLTLQRVLRGIHEQKIKQDDLEPALQHLSSGTPGGPRQLKDSISDEQLRAFLAECKRVAEQAEIPEEPFQLKLSDEFRRAIDRALARKGEGELQIGN